MKNEILSYAEKLDSIGDRIIDISNKIPPFQNEIPQSKEELAAQKEQLEIAHLGYQEALRDLRNIKAPSLVNGEHDQLIEGVSSFVHGTKILNDSINVENLLVDTNELEQGFAIRDIGTKNVEVATKKIGDKLEKAIK